MIHSLATIYNSILRRISALREQGSRAIQNSKVHDIAITFFTEVAVLVAVFPVLDIVIEDRRTQGNGVGINWRTIIIVLVIVSVALLAAIVIAVKGKGE